MMLEYQTNVGKQCNIPPKNGNGNHTSYKHGEIGYGKHGIVLPKLNPMNISDI